MEDVRDEQEKLHDRQRLAETLALANGKRDELLALTQFAVLVEEALRVEYLRILKVLQKRSVKVLKRLNYPIVCRFFKINSP